MNKRNQTLFLIGVFLAFGYVATQRSPGRTAPAVVPANAQTAIFAGGCFWCMEKPFEQLPGVVIVESGYTGGHVENPTYGQVCGHDTGHVEAVRVTFDPSRIAYKDLLEVFWRQIDPTDAGGQFVDRGPPYETGIFVTDAMQRKQAEESRQQLVDSRRFEKAIVTPIRSAEPFYMAEDYHQDYYLTHSLRYKYYRYMSGRDSFIDGAWGSDRVYQPQPVGKQVGQPVDQPVQEDLDEENPADKTGAFDMANNALREDLADLSAPTP